MLKHYLWVEFLRNVISVFQDFKWILILFRCVTDNNESCLFQGHNIEIMARDYLDEWY